MSKSCPEYKAAVKKAAAKQKNMFPDPLSTKSFNFDPLEEPIILALTDIKQSLSTLNSRISTLENSTAQTSAATAFYFLLSAAGLPYAAAPTPRTAAVQPGYMILSRTLNCHSCYAQWAAAIPLSIRRRIIQCIKVHLNFSVHF